jgi:hypothetical protein
MNGPIHRFRDRADGGQFLASQLANYIDRQI